MSVEKKILDLPSRFLVYEGIAPGSVKIGLLKGKHEKVIAEISPDNYDRKLLQVISDVLEGIPVNSLTLGDRKFVQLRLAINSYSKDFPIKFPCDRCGANLDAVVDLASIPVVELPAEFKEPYAVTLSDGKPIYLRLLRVEDELKVAEAEKSGQNIWLYRFSRSIVDNNMSALEKVQFLEELPAIDVAKIRAFHDKYDHGPLMEFHYECDKCGGDGVMPVPFRLEMLFPIGQTLKRCYGASV
jgi:hypothetical protein